MKTTPGAAKETLKRLEKKGFLSRKRFKAGRGGWSVYELPEPIYKTLSIRDTRAKLGTNREQTENKPGTEPGTEPGTTPPSSSSYIENNFKPTTTAENARARSNEWSHEDLDYSMLTDIGFGRSQAVQLRSLGISFDVVQRSLVYFDFELRYTASGKTIQEPLALLMKRMRQNGCWEAPEEYEKRHAHFRTRFGEREHQLLETESAATSNGEHPQTDAIIGPTPEAVASTQ